MVMQPGGTPKVPFTKSAQTRANNSTRNAARSTMVGNQAAQQSIRNQTSKTSATQPGAVGPTVQQSAVQQPAAPVQIPTGGPQMPVEAAEGFDPGVFVDQAIGDFVGQIKLKNFIESPRVKDAMESIRLKNLMNSDNPKYQQDPRTLFQQVVSKIGMSDGQR